MRDLGDSFGVPSDKRAFVCVVLLAAVVAAAFVWIVQWRYAIFRNDVDLGIFSQVISSTTIRRIIPTIGNARTSRW
jgi:uncharacterized membrane protein